MAKKSENIFSSDELTAMLEKVGSHRTRLVDQCLRAAKAIAPMACDNQEWDGLQQETMWSLRDKSQELCAANIAISRLKMLIVLANHSGKPQHINPGQFGLSIFE